MGACGGPVNILILQKLLCPYYLVQKDESVFCHTCFRVLTESDKTVKDVIVIILMMGALIWCVNVAM
jgi:hypothetical protein